MICTLPLCIDIRFSYTWAWLLICFADSTFSYEMVNLITGQALGTVFGLPMSGFIAASPLGWPGIFRFYGIVSGLLGAVLWCVAADAPAQHPKISVGERKYIEDELGNGAKTKVFVYLENFKFKKCLLRAYYTTSAQILISPPLYRAALLFISLAHGEVDINYLPNLRGRQQKIWPIYRLLFDIIILRQKKKEIQKKNNIRPDI